MAQKLTEEQLQEARRRENMKQWKIQLEREELLARMNRASYEKMDYYIKGLELAPIYAQKVNEMEERNKALREEQEKLFTDAANEALAENPTNPASSNTDPE